MAPLFFSTTYKPLILIAAAKIMKATLSSIQLPIKQNPLPRRFHKAIFYPHNSEFSRRDEAPPLDIQPNITIRHEFKKKA